MSDDMALVRDYARSNSEQAFATLVSRHVNMVYSVALRHVGDAALAEDVTQGVFIILAKKAGSLGPKTILSAWLCRTARYVSAHALRTQVRRQAREQEAYMQSMNEADADAWKQIAPMLDEALGSLTQPEQDAVVLRFFEGKGFQEISAATGTNQDTARMRVSRAVEKLRGFFSKKGVVLSATVFTGVVAANSVQAAPAGLAATTVTAAKGAVVATTVTTLAQSAMKAMNWLKLKFAVGIGVAALAAGGIVIALEPKPIAEHAQEVQMLIVPKVNIGKLKGAMKTNEVESILGKPDRWEKGTMVYESRYGLYLEESEFGLLCAYCGLRPSAPATAKQFTGKLNGGVGVGSTRDEVIESLGKPYNEYAAGSPSRRFSVIDYRSLGVQFIMASGKVEQILVFLHPKLLRSTGAIK